MQTHVEGEKKKKHYGHS